jgi:aspartate racemase
MENDDDREVPDRVIGILGGMGPEATLDLFRHITKLTPATKDQDHIRILIYSNPKIPDRTEAITGGGENPLPKLIESARILERGGAGIIAISCNAAHYYFPGIQEHIGIPIKNMIEETCRAIRMHLSKARSVGLLAATGTVHSGVYEKVLSEAGIETLIPSISDQRRIQEAIAQVKSAVHDLSTQRTFESIGMQLEKSGAEALILGCTEIPLVFNPEAVNCPTFNPTKILAQAVLDWALKK